jgi:hypothetical protein
MEPFKDNNEEHVEISHISYANYYFYYYFYFFYFWLGYDWALPYSEEDTSIFSPYCCFASDYISSFAV